MDSALQLQGTEAQPRSDHDVGGPKVDCGLEVDPLSMYSSTACSSKASSYYSNSELSVEPQVWHSGDKAPCGSSNSSIASVNGFGEVKGPYKFSKDRERLV